MNYGIKNKLAKYKMTAGAILATTAVANADIIYTDIDPDTTIGLGQTFEVRIDTNSLATDLFFRGKGGGKFREIVARGSWGIAFGSSISSKWYLASYLSSGDYVDSFMSFNGDNNYLGWVRYSGSVVAQTYGQFMATEQAFIGFRHYEAGKMHYGWARVSTDTNYRNVTIHDYAWNDIPDSSIKVGVLPVWVDSVHTLSLANLDVNGNASDLSVSFDLADDETGIAEYRVYVVEDDTNLADISIRELRSSSYYTSFAPGTPITNIALDESTREYTGSFIKGNTSYRFVVITVPDPNAGYTNHKMSTYSNAVTLRTFPADVVSQLTIEDIGNNCSGLDILVSFNKAQNESGITQYSIMLVKSSKADQFTLDSALAVEFPLYFSMITGGDVTQNLNVYSKDTDGDLIKAGVPYKAFVLSLGDDMSHYSQLSAPSNELTLDNCGVGIEEDLNWNADNIFVSGNVLHTNLPIGNNGGALTVFDVQGKMVAQDLQIRMGTTMNLGHLTKGVYITQVVSNSRVISKRIIVQ